jgi:hypothetical protein
MRKITRRAALKGTAAVAAVSALGAPLAVIPLRATAEDAEVFALIEKRGCQLKIERAASIRCVKAATSLMPPELRAVDTADSSNPRWREANIVFFEICKRPEIQTLFDERRRQDETCRGLEKRLAETPASTLAGIHAKLQDAIGVGHRGRYLHEKIALSAADDVARLVGQG